MTSRTLQATYPAHRDDIGDLVTRRPVPGPGIDQVDPFLFLNHHGPQHYAPNNHGLPFGPHPHRGFETVTFILEGDLSHLDTGGHESVIHAGGVQWMTAGSGLVHAEISPEAFKRTGGPLEILQLWVNLPSRLKMTKPAYIGLQRDDIPSIAADGGKINIELISGEWQANGQRHQGPITSLTGVQMMVLTLSAGAHIDLPAPVDKNVFFYVVNGAVALDREGVDGGATANDGAIVKGFHLARLRNDGDRVSIRAIADSRVLFGLADPIGEPVVSHGPFVMNTREEIHEAIRDYQAGLFGNGLDHLSDR